MSSLSRVLLLAAAASAEITTSIWMPNGYDSGEVVFEGSVVGVSDGHTTLAINYADSEMQGDMPWAETITYAPTVVEARTIVTDTSFSGDYTYSVSCNKARAGRAPVTCQYDIEGALAWTLACQDINEGLETSMTEFEQELPEFCTEGTTLPDAYAKDKFTLAPSEVETYTLIITAGEDKLEATAGASASDSSATPTASNSQASGSQNSGTASAPTGSGASGTAGAPAEETGAAQPLRVAAPALAGLGAAVAAFML